MRRYFIIDSEFEFENIFSSYWKIFFFLIIFSQHTKFGLTTLRDIILSRPPYRQRCLEMLLEFAKYPGSHFANLQTKQSKTKQTLTDFHNPKPRDVTSNRWNDTIPFHSFACQSVLHGWKSYRFVFDFVPTFDCFDRESALFLRFCFDFWLFWQESALFLWFCFEFWLFWQESSLFLRFCFDFWLFWQEFTQEFSLFLRFYFDFWLFW